MEYFKIAVIPGDGIGKEVIPEGIKVINAALSRNGDCKMVFDNFD